MQQVLTHLYKRERPLCFADGEAVDRFALPGLPARQNLPRSLPRYVWTILRSVRIAARWNMIESSQAEVRGLPIGLIGEQSDSPSNGMAHRGTSQSAEKFLNTRAARRAAHKFRGRI